MAKQQQRYNVLPPIGGLKLSGNMNINPNGTINPTPEMIAQINSYNSQFQNPQVAQAPQSTGAAANINQPTYADYKNIPYGDYNSLLDAFNNNQNGGNRFIQQLFENNPKNELLTKLNEGYNFGSPGIANLQSARFNSVPTPSPELRPQANEVGLRAKVEETAQPLQSPDNELLKKLNWKQRIAKEYTNPSELSKNISRTLFDFSLGALSGYDKTADQAFALGLSNAGQGYKKRLQEESDNQLYGTMYKQIMGEEPPKNLKLNKDSINTVVSLEKEKRQAKTEALIQTEKELNIVEKTLRLANLPDEIKTELEQKKQDLLKTKQDIQKGNIELKYLPDEKQAGINEKVANANLANTNAQFAPTLKQQQVDLNTLQGSNLKSQIETRKVNNEQKAQNAKGDLSGLNKQLDYLEKLSSKVPNKDNRNPIYNAFDPLRRMDTPWGNSRTPNENEFQSTVNLLQSQIIRQVGAERGASSDRDQIRAQEALPKFTDSYSQKIAKIKAVRELIGNAKKRQEWFGYSPQSESKPMDNDTSGDLVF